MVVLDVSEIETTLYMQRAVKVDIHTLELGKEYFRRPTVQS